MRWITVTVQWKTCWFCHTWRCSFCLVLRTSIIQLNWSSGLTLRSEIFAHAAEWVHSYCRESWRRRRFSTALHCSNTSSCTPQVQQSLNFFPLASTVKSWLNTCPAVTEWFSKWQENEELWVARWAARLLSCLLRRQPAPANTRQRIYLCNIFVSPGSFLTHLDMHSFVWLISVLKWLNKQLKCNF